MSHSLKFTLTQKNVEVLQLIQAWLLVNGIESTLLDQENKKGQHWGQLYFYAKWRARKLYDLIRPHMHHPDKIDQIERWIGKAMYSNSGYGEDVQDR